MQRSGDVVRVDFGLPRGSTPGFERPAIVVTSNATLDGHPRTLHVVPLTTNTRRRLTAEVPVDHVTGFGDSVAQCHLLQVISVEQLIEEASAGMNVGPVSLTQIREVIGDLLEIGSA